jgi:peptidyl-prolyl cis-trans isomerase B (cyclophilin B)
VIRGLRASLALGLLAAGLLLAGCTSATEGAAQATAPPAASSAAPGIRTSPGKSAGGQAQCDFQATPDQPAPAGKSVGTPPKQAPSAGPATVALHTSAGDIALKLDRSAAPCTVASFEYLAQQKFFDNTPCHRLTTYPTLKVLQCGDPTGSGTGGPGYTIPDELPKNLKPASDGQADVYPAGSVAMANTGQPHTGGSQFFLVYGDSDLPPSYTLFGTVDSAGMAVLSKIAAGGVIAGTDPSTGAPSTTDGKPATPVTITTATAS